MLSKMFLLIVLGAVIPGSAAIAQTDCQQELRKCDANWRNMKDRFAACDIEREKLITSIASTQKELSETKKRLSNTEATYRGYIATTEYQLRAAKSELNREKQKSEKIAADFAQYKSGLNNQEQKRAEAILNTISRDLSFDQTKQTAAPPYERNGKIYQVTKLAIGVLTIAYAPKQKIEPGSRPTLIAIFEPTPIISPDGYPALEGEEKVRWFIKAQYKPQVMDAVLDKENSDNEGENRLLNLNGEKQIWTWRLSSPYDFKNDKSFLYLYVYYQSPDGSTSHEKKAAALTIDWEAESAPGTLSKVMSFLKDNITYIIGIIGALVTMWATIATVRNQRLQTQIDLLKLQVSDGTTSPPAKQA
jgi:hypothetical protein